ncbi:MAG: hypothetical protein ACREM9_04515, partial [Gemmatimonadales bacterium]
MAITAAERRALAGAALVVVAGLASVGSCTPGAPPAEQPAPEPIPGPSTERTPDRTADSDGPRLRVGLAVGVPSATIGGDADLMVTDPGGARLAAIPAGEQWRVVPSGTGVSVQPPSRVGSSPSEVVAVVATDPAAPVRVNGRTYR